MAASNQMTRAIAQLGNLPAFMRQWATSTAFGRTVKFAGTAGIQFESLKPGEVTCSIANKSHVQNHIGGVHAAAMALLAETATGFVVGISLPDDKLPLLKSMHVDYTKRAAGGLRAVATLSPEQIEQLKTQPKGAVTVPVVVTDKEGKEPISAEFVWAWIPKPVKGAAAAAASKASSAPADASAAKPSSKL
ncbi:hypothetical protein CAOG_01684 [Capsaspora owczarzaki ATCC 30864]|uniref:DUF4442 domain-containing protein n=1 Tax=Capsaspora owczarzaki (strain ATCC 30864) TaxID=595528 RepID=A0A0D2VK15_CAPO3|nr:hypothetical protein CAOG_01684 [Capsaspora owczarzaki ATCC 30864]KJE90362.1 hypothetical protein CAOG_001684 [Capsaspora owczarzaki ATCC 30864]|eukprot:XP_004364552.2 hypothetical protein CAOG_01684 [Capsaspora owczarzaki ATCC 30864]